MRLVRARFARAAIAAVLSSAALVQGPASAETQAYTYDALGRLVKVAHTNGPYNGATACYAYDAASNRSNVTASTSSSNCANSGSGLSFTITSNGSVTEGSPSVFTVTKVGTTAATLTLNYATSDLPPPNAVAGVRYTATSGSLTFLPTDTVKTMSVSTIDDSTYEGTQSFLMSLTNAVGGGIVGTANGVINDNDPQSQPPVTQPDSISLTCNTSGNLNVTANDSDPGGHIPLTVISAVVTSGGATASIYSASTLTIYADTMPGTSTITYTVKNTLNATATGTVTVTTTGTIKSCSM